MKLITLFFSLGFALNLTDYDSNESPSSLTILNFFLEISHIFNIEENENHMKAIFAYAVEWTDPRLEFASNASAGLVEIQNLSSIWRPSFAVLGLKENKSDIFEKLTVYRDGRVTYSYKGAKYFGCYFDLELIPYDEHECRISIVDFSSAEHPTVFSPINAKPDTSNGMLILDVYMTEWAVADYYLAQTNTTVLGKNYSGVDAHVKVTRRKTYNLYFIVLPGFLIVGLAYASFWIDYRAQSSRTTFATITVLTSLTQLYNTFWGYPRLGYNNWLLQFLSVNTIFTVIAMLEFVVVNRLHIREEQKIRRNNAKKKLRTVNISVIDHLGRNNQKDEDLSNSNNNDGWWTNFKRWAISVIKSPPKLVDDSFRVAFVVMYFAFILDLFKDIQFP